MRTPFRFAVAVALTSALLAACSGAASPTPAPSPSPAASVAASPAASPSPSPAASPSPAPSPSPDACAPGNLATLAAGKLTIGTDNPAYPPYFAARDGGNTPPWNSGDFTGDPTTGQGFESAVAYAIADKLGFTKDAVVWIPVKFDNSYAPGPKTFDFDINQISYTAARAESVDMSDSYYPVNQAVVALKGSAVSKVTSIAQLAPYKFGVQAGTTSFDAITNVIKPTTEPSVFDSNDAAITALKNKQIDAIVVDLPTADFVTNVQVDTAVTVGKFPAAATDYFSLVLEKGSPNTACVNRTIQALTDNGTLKALVSTWLPFQDTIPAFRQ